MVWPNHVYSRFTLEIINLLNSLLFPKKRNEKFFKGVELLFEDQNANISKENIRSLLSKFYKKAFGSESQDEIQQIQKNIFLSEDQTFKFLIQKEELANYEEECYDFILDLDDFYARQRKDFPSPIFHRNNFYEYFVRYFISKRGVQILVNFARGQSAYMSLLNKNSVSNKNIISAKFLMPILELLFNISNYIPKLSKYSKVISYDGNFVNFSNSEDDDNILKKESKAEEKRVLNIETSSINDAREETLLMTAALGLDFLCQFKLNETFINDLDKVVDIIFYVEKITNMIRSLPRKTTLLESLSVKANGRKINKKLYLEILINIIKLYLENPNYAQKMSACDLLNNISNYVRYPIIK